MYVKCIYLSKIISNWFSISNKSWHHLSSNKHIRTFNGQKGWLCVIVRQCRSVYDWQFHFILNRSIIWRSKTKMCNKKTSSYIMGWKNFVSVHLVKDLFFSIVIGNGSNKHSEVSNRIVSRWRNSPIHSKREWSIQERALCPLNDILQRKGLHSRTG